MPLRLALVALLFSIGLEIAQAEDGDSEAPAAPGREEGAAPTLKEVVVTADRRVETPVNNIPGAVSVLEGEELEDQLDFREETEDVLSELVPGYNDNTFPSIRGRRALVLINGAPQNETLRESSGYDVENIDPELIERIEVSRGATALYGSGAPGGVINITTRRAKSETLTARSKVGTWFNTEDVGSSIEPEVFQSVEQKLGDFDYYVGVGYQSDRLPFDADGERIPDFSGDTDDINAATTLGYQLTSDSEIVFRGAYQHREIDRSWSLVNAVVPEQAGQAQHDRFADDGWLRDQVYTLIFNDTDLVGGTGLKVELHTHRHFDTENQDFGEGIIVDDRLSKDSYGVRTTLNTPIDALLTEGSRLIYGFDFLRDEFDRPAVNIATGQIETYFVPDVRLDTYAPYAQMELPIGDFLLSGGVRHEEYRGSTEDTSGVPGGITGGDVRDENLTLFNVGLVYFATEEIETYASVSQGTDITQLGRAARSASTVEQIRLEPDESTQYEIGVRGDFSDYRFGLATFYTESDNGVTLVPDPEDPVNNPLIVRREPRKTWGVEVIGDYRLAEELSIGGLASFQEGRVDTNDDGDYQWMTAREISPAKIVTYLEHRPSEWFKHRIQPSFRFERDQFDSESVEFGEGNVGSVFLLHYYSVIKVGPGELLLGVENLLNKDYYSQQAESDQSEFTWAKDEGRTVAANYRFAW